MIGWWRLGRELDRWAAAGHQPRLWWRDDDAAEATPSLHRLIGLAERFQVPLLLAVVPGEASSSCCDTLSTVLANRSGVFVGQHGVTHANRRRPGEPNAEFPAWETSAVIAAAVGAAWPRVAALPGSLPIFIPPWNNVHPALEAALRSLGLVLSAGGASALDAAPAQLDVLRWKSGPAFGGRGRCLRRLRRALQEHRISGDWTRPVGLLTHHLVHDAKAWAFLELLLARTHADPRIAWVSPAELVHLAPGRRHRADP